MPEDKTASREYRLDPAEKVGSDAPLICDSVTGSSAAVDTLSLINALRAKPLPVPDPKLRAREVTPLDDVSGLLPVNVAATRLLLAFVETVAQPVTTRRYALSISTTTASKRSANGRGPARLLRN